jgi:molecular chaperone DnaK (HSP70)
MSRYIIGIDLGTTNSCVAYVDTQNSRENILPFKIPQISAPYSVEAFSTLPSSCYLSTKQEWVKESVTLPWQKESDYLIGTFAQKQGEKIPTRLVQSAKSWLCHSAANRREKILPVEAAEESMRISPLEASARYLRHIREAWDAGMAKGDSEAEFDSQEIILTVPASFDEIARCLTIEAARVAGYMQVTLLEEPQAAFYSWISLHEQKWEHILPPGSLLLVCDVGGGTTDFSLIEVVSVNGKSAFRRIAVGEHLLLGGDNMDAAVVHLIESKLSKETPELTLLQRLQLRHQARHAKEFLLNDQNANKEYRVVLQGVGSHVVSGNITVLLQKEELLKLLIQGFFSNCTLDEGVIKSAGMRTMGLPYESEPSIIKHLAHFLNRSGKISEKPQQPDWILFNGGTMKPQPFQQAIVDALHQWFPSKNVQILPSANLDLAVARGAGYYGKVRRGLGVKIGGGLSCGYYLIIESKNSEGKIEQKALNLLPKGCEEGTVFKSSNIFQLSANSAVSFQLCASNTRLHDQSGDLISINPEEMRFLPPIRTILRYGKDTLMHEKIPVQLQMSLTSIGALEMALIASKTEHRWLLEFQIRSASGHENSSYNYKETEKSDQTFQIGYVDSAREAIKQIFEPHKEGTTQKKVMEILEDILTLPRKEWPPSIMRSLADVVIKEAARRKLSPTINERWWNLTGFLLRPGFGYPLDDFRLKELWKIILNDYKSPSSIEVQIQTWICYRRIAGGLNKGQQMQIANDLMNLLLNKKTAKIEINSRTELYPYSEKLRAFASMELIQLDLKTKVGNALIERLTANNGIDAEYWALGRIAARHLLYGSLANVLNVDLCKTWTERVLESIKEVDERSAFLMGQMARKTEHREINLPSSLIDKILEKFAGSPFEARLLKLLLEETHLTVTEQEKVFGDCLPPGLLLV